MKALQAETIKIDEAIWRRSEGNKVEIGRLETIEES
jgi:hypothetical protein